MIASTTYERGMFRAGVRSICSCWKNFNVAGINSITKIATTTEEIASSTRLTGSDTRRSSAVMRMCSPRRYATTAPSIASQSSRIVASSSPQIKALCIT